MSSYSRLMKGMRGTWSRILSLGSVPGSPEETRAFLQRRISLFFAANGAIGWTLYVVSMGLRFAWREEFALPELLSPLRLLHLGLNLFVTGAFLATRRGARSMRTLNLLDGFGTLFIVGIIVALMLIPVRERYAPEFQFLVAVVITLAARAAIVPSEPSRTAAIGLASAALFVGAAGYLNFTTIRPYAPPAPMVTIVIAVWGIVAAGVTTLVSREIYGLQKRVVDAMQLGQYTLDCKIGEGGMGVVYRASHALLRRPTAIKLLTHERTGAQALARFEREVQVTSQLTHPNTVAIYDFGRTPEGIFYYAMEYLDGLDLETMVELDGPQPAARVRHVLEQAAGALAEAHAAGLVHRDIKPANIILCERGTLADFAKVVDFGLVREIERKDPALSAEAEVVGTPLFMAPEAIADPRAVDGRSDIYALGAVAYWMLTGAVPFEGGSVLQVLARALHEPVLAPSVRLGRDIPRALEDLVMRCLAKDPALRPASAAQLAEELAELPGVERWSQAQARAWWAQNAETVAALRAPKASSPLDSTVRVLRRGGPTVVAAPSEEAGRAPRPLL
jgi:serine/threonine-protein kinase